MSEPMFVTADEVLLDELLRLSAAAGVTPHVARDGVAGLRGWTAAPLVLVGADQARAMAHTCPPRRPKVHVVAMGQVPDDLFRVALAIGAESVAAFPGSEAWLVEELTDLGDARSERALTLGVVGGSGGVGATTFACALGQMASRSGQAVVIDLDPLGPGIDRVLGLEACEGMRWDELGRPTGRLSARSLREALPRSAGLGVLTWNAGPHGTLQAFAVREALSAAQRGHDTVVMDLPRGGDELVDEVVARCDQLLVVTAPTVSGVASAARVCAGFTDAAGALGLVIRGAGADPRDVARVVGAPVIAEMPDQRGLAESIDLGLGPVRSRRGPLGRTSLRVLDSFARLEPAA
ncbi:septum site-determining protein Ssd [Nocardioides sp.]|uniref:septum site-determining protein Ssd n=1 Tax=Nocardioides sp. TaxID=35761 RepID=UPI002D7F0282|nr:septum site-determining protein Ssd [Nocardioides sp.]HET8961961.1 septum site-determining protein Ssd [Nocardioides sp.]